MVLKDLLVLLPQHKKYCTTRKELLAVVRFCVYYRNYLLGRQFLVRTDHNSLAWLSHFHHIEGQLARWLEVLAQFDFQIIHRPGNKHSNADALSRIPDRIPPCNCYEAGTKLEDLPCGGCHYCTRAHNQWERYDLDFDDVVLIAVRHPLAEASDTGTMARSAQLPIQGDESQATGNSTEKKDFTGLPLFKLLSAELPALDTGESDDSDDNRSVVPSSPDHDDNNNQLDLEVNWMANYSPAILKQHQMEDKDLQPILNWLEEEDPTAEELYLCSPTTKALWLHKQQLQTKNGVLYYSWEDPIENRLLLVVPESLKETVLQECHDAKFAGHLGRDKTLARLRQSFFWHNMPKDCEIYIKSCHICSKNKKLTRRQIAKLGCFHSGFPMERVHMDILGPFTPSEDNNKYVLMIIDQFSKWVQCIPIPEQSAKTVAENALKHFVSTFGCPITIHTDQGSNFESDLSKAFCTCLDVSKTRTTPYYPASNGAIERQTRTVLQMIRCYILDNIKDWDKDLPIITIALHSMINKATGFSANMIMLGRKSFNQQISYSVLLVRS